MKTEKSFRRIRSIYSFWGRSGLYGPLTFLTFLGRERAIRKLCVDQLDLQKGDRVIDIACGTGRNHPYLVKAVGPTGEIVALDYTPEMLERARRQAEAHGWHNISFIQGDAAAMEMPAASFDGAICVLGLSVIPRHEEAVRRAIKSLKPGRKMVVCDAVPFHGKWRFLNLLVKPVYAYLACWNPQKDILAVLKSHTKNLTIYWFLGGAIYVATGTRR